MGLEGIPVELQRLRQWVVSDASKVPRDARTGGPASVTDPSTWSTFDEAKNCLNGKFTQVGFVLTTADPYTFLDLDNKQSDPDLTIGHRAIVEAADSYAEASMSGLGIHVCVKGAVPTSIHSRDHGVEVYSSGHYVILTGNVVRAQGIEERQAFLDKLVALHGSEASAAVALVERPETIADEDLFEMAMGANNGEKFDQLCRGMWQELGYASQSEADFALLGILAFYSECNQQVRRLFRYSALGRREKAQKNNVYLNRSLAKIRAAEPPRVDSSALLKGRGPGPAAGVSRRLVPWNEFKKPRGCTLKLVEGVFGAGAISAVYGESGSAKSFFVLSWASRVALGRPFLGRKTEQGPVVLFVGEGAAGMQQRVAAMAAEIGDVSPPILFFPHPMGLPDDAGEVLKLLQEAAVAFGAPPALVIFDTLNCYFGDGDENSTKDMKRYVDVSRRILEALPLVHVSHVHHTGKDQSKGLRGSSVLRAAVDTALECKRLGDGQFEAVVSKQKDGADGVRFQFHLRPVEFEVEGRVERSCVAEWDQPPAGPGASSGLPLPVGRDRTGLRILQEQVRSVGVFSNEVRYSEQYLEGWYSMAPGELRDTVLRRARRCLESLRDTYHAVDWRPKDPVIRLLPDFHELCIRLEQEEQ